mmetsp:Transcript_111755/g.360741  ORF Transcript_111755/g.360741 Transcript_111755/m.360741 type:complete len:203 (-) Transcript_111755:1088-1696(-)
MEVGKRRGTRTVKMLRKPSTRLTSMAIWRWHPYRQQRRSSRTSSVVAMRMPLRLALTWLPLCTPSRASVSPGPTMSLRSRQPKWPDAFSRKLATRGRRPVPRSLRPGRDVGLVNTEKPRSCETWTVGPPGRQWARRRAEDWTTRASTPSPTAPTKRPRRRSRGADPRCIRCCRCRSLSTWSPRRSAQRRTRTAGRRRSCLWS